MLSATISALFQLFCSARSCRSVTVPWQCVAIGSKQTWSKVFYAIQRGLLRPWRHHDCVDLAGSGAVHAILQGVCNCLHGVWLVQGIYM